MDEEVNSLWWILITLVDDDEGCLRESVGVYDLVIVTFFSDGDLKVKSFEVEALVVDLERDLEVDEWFLDLGVM